MPSWIICRTEFSFDGRERNPIKLIANFIKKNKLYPLLLVPLGLILTLLARLFPTITESFYSQGIYPFIANLVGTLTSYFPFSIGELMIILLVLAVLAVAVFGIREVILVACKKKKSAFSIKKISCKVACVASIFYFVFVMFCGINYYRLEFQELSGLNIKPSSVSELSSLCEELIEQANSRRLEVSTDENGVMLLGGTTNKVANNARNAVNSLNEKYDFMFKAGIKPKAVFGSKVMSHMNITGIFSPFTVEANVNVDIPHYDIPVTMCHELAHTRGFMREDEANFIAYLACQNSSEADFRYSGTMLALVYSMNRLYDADYDRFEELYATYSEGLRLDFEANGKYWKQFEGKVAEVSSMVNDTYLKANSQKDGVSSYGRMVDLLLAKRREGLGK